MSSMILNVSTISQLALGSAFGYCVYNAYKTRSSQQSPEQSLRGSTPSLTTRQIELVKATIPVLQKHGTTITTVFYKNMLNAHHELNDIFNTVNQTNGQQPRALAASLFAYASHIDDLGKLGPLVELIRNRHASLYVRPEEYEIVGKYLLEAMGEVLGDTLTDEIRGAWAAAYWVLANVLIDREAALYKQSEGWSNWRDFTVAEKIPESDEITSFYLKPVDGKPLPSFRPGQFISVRLLVPELKYLQARQYSLSDKPRPDYYRISVKRELGLDSRSPTAESHLGSVSNVLHDNVKKGDTLQVSHPFGDFFLSSEEATHPVVLLAAGVGVTPLNSILNTIASKSGPNSDRKVHFIHGCRTTKVRAFKSNVESLVTKFPNMKTTFFITELSSDDKRGIDYHHVGRINLQSLRSVQDLYLDDPRTEFYICGPENFMTDMKNALKERQVNPDRIKMELFGSGGFTHG